jgi:CDP-glycerol glycerophosphotransferase (TagB/SpsB family)
MRQLLRRSRILRKVRFLPYAALYAIACLAVRQKVDRYLFLADTHLGFTGNFGFLREELERQKPDAEVIGIFKENFSAPRSLRDIFRLPFLIASSRTIILDDFFPMIYSLRLRPGARLIQVWHAVGAFKRVGHSRAGLPGGLPSGSNVHLNYTAATVPAEGCRADYAEAFGIDPSKVLPLGVPRTDVFFDSKAVASKRVAIRQSFGVEDDIKLVLFAPTFRGTGPTTAYGVDVDAWAKIAADLGAGYRVAVRQHPFVRRLTGELPGELIDASHGDMNELLMATDVLVTDYSSSILEFALLRRPYVLYVPDLDTYEATRSFYRPFDFYAAGAIVTDHTDLVGAIREGRLDHDKLDMLVEEFCSSLDGKSSERIVQQLLL